MRKERMGHLEADFGVGESEPYRRQIRERMHHDDEHVVASGGVGGRQRPEPLRRRERMGHLEADFGVGESEPYRRQRRERMSHPEDEHVATSGVGGRQRPEPFVGTVHRRRQGRENFTGGMSQRLDTIRANIASHRSGPVGAMASTGSGVAGQISQVAQPVGAANVFGAPQRAVRVAGVLGPGSGVQSQLAVGNADTTAAVLGDAGGYFRVGRLLGNSLAASAQAFRDGLPANASRPSSTARLTRGGEGFRRREGFTPPPDEVRVQEPFKSRAKRGNTKAGPQRGVERMMQRPAPKKNMMREQYMRVGNKRR